MAVWGLPSANVSIASNQLMWFLAVKSLSSKSLSILKLAPPAFTPLEFGSQQKFQS